MKKIKVLHVIKTLSLGGAETNLYNLVNATDDQRFETHVAYSFGGEIESRFLSRGIRLFKYAEAPHKIKSWASLVIIFRLARYIWRHDIQIVHTHIFNAHVWGTLAAKLTGRKLVEHVHDFRYMERKKFVARRGTGDQFRFAPYFKNLSDAVIVLTRETRDFILTHGLYPAKRIKEIKNGIPLLSGGARACAQIRKKLQIPEGRFVLLTSARIAPEKNLDLFFKVAPAVRAELPNVLFLIVGNGPLLETSLAKVRQMGLQDHLRFIGFHPAIDDLLAVSDLFLLPSFLELHSIAVLEAMSMKVPVLLSQDVGCHEEFIASWKNGVLLNPLNEQEWIQAILRLANDSALRRAMGEQGFATCIEQFSIQKISQKIGDLYVELAHS